MSSTRKLQKILLALFVMTVVASLIWVLRGQVNSSQPLNTLTVKTPSTPTDITDTGFVVNIPQKALWKNYVTVSAEASSGTKCGLIYIPPSGNIHQTDTIADTSGLCVWNWKIEEAEGKGNGRLIFTIEDISETHFMEIRSGF